MSFVGLLIVCIYVIIYVNVGLPDGVDCPMKQFLLEYAVEIQPSITDVQLQEMADALNGSPLGIYFKCNVSYTNPNSKDNRYDSDSGMDLNDGNTIYVSTKDGNDGNHGLSLAYPLKTIHAAVNRSRVLFGKDKLKQILLREGTYYIGKTVRLTHLDSNLVIKPYNYEYVNISGAVPLKTNFQRYGNKNGNVIYYTDVTDSNIQDIWGLRINGYRGTYISLYILCYILNIETL